MKKCKECEYAKAYNVPRNGNGASWRSGHFSQKGYVCSHKDGESKLPIIFYGETAPRKCPLRNGGQKRDAKRKAASRRRSSSPCLS